MIVHEQRTQDHHTAIAPITSDAQALPTSTSTPVSCQRPQQGRLECNVDACFSTQRNHACIGICVCDDAGDFVLAKTMSFTPLCPVAMSELGVFYVLQWLQNMQFDNVDFVVDFKTTTDAFHPKHNDVTIFGSIITACICISSHLIFQTSRVEFNTQQTHLTNHALAREATLSASPTIQYDVSNYYDSYY